MVNPKAVDPNPKGGHKYGVGDATIAKIQETIIFFVTGNHREVLIR